MSPTTVRTVETKLSDFTPVSDGLAQELGLVSAVVFGRAWRYCQMEDHVCRASIRTMAEGLGINEATVQRHLKKLTKAGYLRDLTPKARNRPHIYADTGKIKIFFEMKSSVALNHSKKTVAVRNTTDVHGNTTVAQSNETVAQSQLKRGARKQNEERKEEAAASAQNARLYQEKFGTMTRTVGKHLEELERTNSPELVTDAILEAEQSKENQDNGLQVPIAFIEAILKGWKENGRPKSKRKKPGLFDPGRQAHVEEKIKKSGLPILGG